MERLIRGTILSTLLFVVLILAGCAPSQGSMMQLSKHYKQRHDYESLAALLPYLNYTLKRSDVENLLGEPEYCPTLSNCYYPSDKSVIVFCPDMSQVSRATCQSFPLILSVGYNLADGKTPSARDALDGFGVTPIGE